MTEPATVPVLPSADFDRTAAFYAQLGFAETRRWGGDYLILQHPAPIELHFFSSPATEAGRNDHGCYVRFPSADDANRVHLEWKARAGSAVGQAQLTDYGLTEFAVHDPDGNLIRVGGVTGP